MTTTIIPVDADSLAFQSATPFPHLVIDDMWNTKELRAMAEEFPHGMDPRWITYNEPQELGKKAGPQHMWGPKVREWFEYMRSDEAVKMVEALTGIHPLTADDLGGGMHITGENGRLAMHVDFNYHPSLPLTRRINLLVFLNDEWDEAWGGNLYLGKEREVKIVPNLNRTAIFATSESSWHGHPEPIVGDHWRKSLAVYYYTPTDFSAGPPPHTTVWLPD